MGTVLMYTASSVTASGKAAVMITITITNTYFTLLNPTVVLPTSEVLQTTTSNM